MGMKNGITLKRRKAFEIPRGNAVIFTDGGGGGGGGGGGEAMVCLKTERQGKDYIHHYLVVMDPAPAGGFEMIYIDPEDELTDCGGPFTYAMSEGVERGDTRSERADVGDLFRNAGGLFLKVPDHPKSEKMFAFIEIHSGAVMGRQERDVSAVFQDWRVSGLNTGGKEAGGKEAGGKEAGRKKAGRGEDGGLTLDELRRLYSQTG